MIWFFVLIYLYIYIKSYSFTKCLFGSVIAVIFQSVFRAEMYQNNFFNFLKIIFKINASKQSKIYKKLIFSKKILNFYKTCFASRLMVHNLTYSLND